MPISKSHVIWQSWTTWEKTSLSTDVSKHSTAMFVWWHSRARTVATSSPGRTATTRPASIPRASVKPLAQFSTQHSRPLRCVTTSKFRWCAIPIFSHKIIVVPLKPIIETSVSLRTTYVVRSMESFCLLGLMQGALWLLSWVLTMSSCANKHESTATLGYAISPARTMTQQRQLMHMCSSSTHAPMEGAWHGCQVVRCRPTSINKLCFDMVLKRL